MRRAPSPARLLELAKTKLAEVDVELVRVTKAQRVLRRAVEDRDAVGVLRKLLLGDVAR